jgi:dihydrofolate synthase/folylpolyglutamate synthase
MKNLSPAEEAVLRAWNEYVRSHEPNCNHRDEYDNDTIDRTRLFYLMTEILYEYYQEKNLQTAFVALQVLRNYGITGLRDYEITKEAIREGFSHVCSLTGLRGRWETLREKPLVICDTGHNSHGIQYVAQQLKTLPNPHIWIVFGMVNDKDTEVVMRLLPSDDKDHYIFTTPNTKRARTAEEMLAMWSKEGIAIDDPKEAINYALEHAAEEDAVFIGGSNYLVGEALQMISDK